MAREVITAKNRQKRPKKTTYTLRRRFEKDGDKLGSSSVPQKNGKIRGDVCDGADIGNILRRNKYVVRKPVHGFIQQYSSSYLTKNILFPGREIITETIEFYEQNNLQKI